MIRIDPKTNCWEYLGQRKNKYAFLHFGVIRMRLHRLVYRIFHGHLKQEEVVRHTCDNPPCINPEHLVKGDQYQNNEDRQVRGRQAKGESIAQSLLTEAQVKAIRTATGTQKEIAVRFGTTQANVSKIKLRQTWGHLP